MNWTLSACGKVSAVSASINDQATNKANKIPEPSQTVRKACADAIVATLATFTDQSLIVQADASGKDPDVDKRPWAVTVTSRVMPMGPYVG